VAAPVTPRRNLVVEFVGLPGVGKSYAARLVAARLAAAGTPVASSALRVNQELGTFRRVAYKLGLCAGEMLRRPTGAFRVGRVLIRSHQQSRVDVVRLSYNWFFLVGLLRRARARPSVEVLDEGIVQLLWSIGFAGDEQVVRERSSELLAASAFPLPLPDVVVVVEAPLVLIESRLEGRASRAGRVDRIEPAQREVALIRGAHLFGEVLSKEMGLLGGPAPPLVRRIRNADSSQFGADVDALVAELASLSS
jgi:hypothetical protein